MATLTFENTLLKILEAGHVKSMRIFIRALRGARIKTRSKAVDRAKEICKDRGVGALFSLTTPLVIQRESVFSMDQAKRTKV